MKPLTRPDSRVAKLLALGAACALGQPLAAQDAASATESRDDKTTIDLPEFRVDTSQDIGYRATNSISGTRLSAPLKDVPLPIEVLTMDFIEDIGAVDFREALGYSAGITLDFVQTGNNFLFPPSGTGQTGSLRPDSTAINIRGFNTRSQLRNGFVIDRINDNINVGRVEVARGPQALLYGTQILGGVVNILPDYPSNRRRTEVTASFGNYDFRRFGVETTGPLLDRGDASINYRLMFSQQEKLGDDRYDQNLQDRKFLGAMLDIRPWRGTSIFLDLEVVDNRAQNLGVSDVNDAQDGTDRVTDPFLGTQVNNNIFNEGLRLVRDWLGRDDRVEITSPDAFLQEDYWSGTVEVNQRLTDWLQLNIGYNESVQDRDGRNLSGYSISYLNRAPNANEPGPWTNQSGQVYTGATYTRPDGTTVPEWRRDYTGRTVYRQQRYGWSLTDQEVDRQQARIETNATFELFDNPQNFLAGYNYRRTQTDTRSYAMVNAADGAARSFNPRAFDDLSPIAFGQEKFRPFRDSFFREWSSSHYGVYNGTFFDERINIIGGLSRTRYMVRTLEWTYGKVNTALPDTDLANWQRPANYDNLAGYDANGRPVFNNPGANAGTAANAPIGQTPRVDGYRFGGVVQTETSPTFGVSMKFTPAVTGYLVSAGGVFPNTGQRDGNNDPLDAEQSESLEVGVKFDLLKDDKGRTRLSGQMALFQIERENAVYNIFWAPSPRNHARGDIDAWPSALRTTAFEPLRLSNPETSDFFQPSRPTTYLVPVSFFTAAGVTPVAGSDQWGNALASPPAGANADIWGIQNNFVLVRYRRDRAANDPLRQVLDAAYADPTNRTQLGARNTGTTGTSLYANNPYESRNSDVAYSDESTGLELQLNANITESWRMVLNYANLKQRVTGGFRFVSDPFATEYDSFFRYMGYATSDAVRAIGYNPENADVSAGAIGARTVDNPVHSAAMWNNYEFKEGILRGFDVGLGVQWYGQRQGEVVITNGLDDRTTQANQRFVPDFPARWVFNAAIGYKKKFDHFDLGVRLNVNNLTDDNDQVESGELSVINGVVVPTRSIAFYSPRSYRLSVSLDF